MVATIKFRVVRGTTPENDSIQRVVLETQEQANDSWLNNPHVARAEFDVDGISAESQVFQQGKIVTATFTEVAD